MKKIVVLVLIILVSQFLFAGNRIPIPNKQISYNKNDVIKNPKTGEKLVCNQLLVVFDPAIQKPKQEQILKSIHGKVVGGLPSFEIYQITFKNENKSYSELAKVISKLENNKNILFVMPQKTEKGNSTGTKDLVSSVNSERTGGLNSKNLKRKSSTGSSNKVQNTINGHWPGLNACVEKQNRIVETLHGKILFTLVVTPKGVVKSARINSSSIRNKKITSCMLTKIRKSRDFPKTKGTENRKIDFEFAF